MKTFLDRYRARPSYTSVIGFEGANLLPRLGKIRLGIKAMSAKNVEYPKQTDYFVCPEEVQTIYGEKPKVIEPVYIPCEDENIFFPKSLKWWKGAQCFCRGNGKIATRVTDDGRGTFDLDCPCEHLTDRIVDGREVKAECKIRASLMVLLPNVGMGGCYQIDTGSQSAMFGIDTTIKYLKGFLIGRIAYVPLRLKLVPTKLKTPDGKTVTKPVLTLEYGGNIEDVARLRAKDAIQQLVPADSGPLLALPPAPVHEEEDYDRDTGEIIPKGNGTTLPPMTFPDVIVDTAEEAMVDTDEDGEEGENKEAPLFSPPEKKTKVIQAPPEIDLPGKPPADLSKTMTLPADDEDPFPDPPAPEIQKDDVPPKNTPHRDPMADLAAALRGSKTKEFLNARWQEFVVNNKELSGMQKVELQSVFMEKMRTFKK